VDQQRQACAERGAEDLEDDEHRHRRGAIPVKVSLNMRAMVAAGLVKEVEEVNQ
jgi:hypothetical protein